MSRTWRNSWGPELKARDLRAEYKHNWKRNLNKEEEEVSDNASVFVIINEWDIDDDNTSSEITGGEWFISENEAWSALNIIAEAYGMSLDVDETSFRLAATENLRSEEYRIEELIRG